MRDCVFVILSLSCVKVYGLRLSSSTQVSDGVVTSKCRTDWGYDVDQPDLTGEVDYWTNRMSPLPSMGDGQTAVSLIDTSSQLSEQNTPFEDSCKTYWYKMASSTGSPFIPWVGMAVPGTNILLDTTSGTFHVPCKEEFWKNPEYVHWFIASWKASGSNAFAGGSWKIPSWLFLCGGMRASGDPHVINILGESFDIMSQGDVELIRYPQGADDNSANLVVTSRIDKLGTGCHDTFMKLIRVSGTWLKEVISFRDDEDTGDLLVSKGVVSWEKPIEWRRMNGSDFFKLDDAEIHFPTRKRVSLKISNTEVVVYSSGRPRKGTGTFLNLDLKGFTTLKQPVGGLLGLDSHKKEIELAKDICKKQAIAKSFKLHQKTDDIPLQDDSRLFSIQIS